MGEQTREKPKRARWLSSEDAALLNRWLFDAVVRERETAIGTRYAYPGVTRQQYMESYQSWSRGGRGWLKAEQGGTGIMALLCWYQHIHKPGSREWRPAIILRAALNAARQHFATPTESVVTHV